ncbi:septum site-determining protein MinC [Thermodesulfitimonas sp.]
MALESGAGSWAVGQREKQTILILRTLRSGQSIFYPGNVVIIGDVNPGAQVTATGDVIVVGALRGMVHAGAGGDEGAMVVAFRLEPTQLRIANHISRPPEGMTPARQPEVARIKNGVVTIEAYVPGRRACQKRSAVCAVTEGRAAGKGRVAQGFRRRPGGCFTGEI